MMNRRIWKYRGGPSRTMAWTIESFFITCQRWTEKAYLGQKFHDFGQKSYDIRTDYRRNQYRVLGSIVEAA